MLASPPDPAALSEGSRREAATPTANASPIMTSTSVPLLAQRHAPGEVPAPVTPQSTQAVISERSRDGRMKKMVTRQATQFFGGTSIVQMSLPAPTPIVNSSSAARPPYPASSETPRLREPSPEGLTPAFEPHGSVCRQLVSLFFASCYQYNHFIYREFFLRDYSVRNGPYYSDMLLHAICAVGATVSEDGHMNSLSSAFRDLAESQALGSLESPDLTTLQTLLICGPLEVGQGRSSKGWLFCGMAFRLAHEMGLHLDPNNWDLGQTHSPVDREILRRVYWAAFVSDKQMSLYFGRPPALHPQEADVRNTIRIPYPPEWEHLIDTYIAKGTSATAFEDGIAVVGTFVHRVELAKIFHTMIVTIFEKRDRQANSTETVRATQTLHSQLERWLSQLPQRLQWNPWKVEQVPHYILHLHLAFHTGMIILNRPPGRCSDKDMLAHGEDIDICYHSLTAILSLLKSHERHYSLRTLPLDVVHTLAAASRIIILKKHVEQAEWSNLSVKSPMDQVLRVMGGISTVWPCVVEIKAGIEAMMQEDSQESEEPSSGGHEFLRFLDDGYNSLSTPWPTGMEHADSDLGFLVTEDSLNQFEGWSGLTE